MAHNRPSRLQRAIDFYNRMANLGFDGDETDQLVRIERTLHRWAEAECNGEIEREGENADGRPFRSFAATGGKHLAYPIADREAGAMRRLNRLMAQHPAWIAYQQGDPRGCALYLVDRAKLGDHPIDGYYSSIGVAVCY